MKEACKNIISFWKITIKSSKSFVALLCLNILVSAIAPFPTILLSKKVFDGLASGIPIDQFLLVAGLLVGLTFLFNACSTAINALVETKGQQLMYSLSVSYNLKSANISYEMLSDPKVLEKRELASQAVNGSNFIDMVRCVSAILSNLLILMGVFTLFVRLDFVILCVVMLVILINTYANNLIKKAQYAISVEATPYMRKVGYIQSVASNLDYGKEIRIHNFKPLLIRKIQALNEICFRFIKKGVIAQVKGLETGHITNAVQDVIVYGILGVKVIVDKVLSIGDFSMYFAAITKFKDALTTIVTTITDIKINSLYMGHFLEYMDLPEEQEKVTPEKPETVNIHTIRFENVSFKYPGSDVYVLKNISFTIHEKEKLSIVGVNGSGKTTIIKLLLRLYKPTQGTIWINNTDIQTLDFEEYARRFSVVFQDFKLFAFTITENLCGTDTPDGDKMAQALSMVHLKEKIEALPEQYETNYSRLFEEKGVEFSGGESQKLAIARALYKDAPVVIMDEPTSALDPLAEYEIYREFDALTYGKTAIYISHRLSSCRFCDRILLLSDGAMQECGTHEELMRQNGLYADMYHKQAQYYVEENGAATQKTEN